MNGRYILTALAGLALAPTASAGPIVATYQFGNTLSAAEPGVPALTAFDPAGSNRFETANVFGSQRTVYHWFNTSPPSRPAGLVLNVSSLIPTDSYSVEMVFAFDTASGIRRVLDALRGSSDDGLYVGASGALTLFEGGGSVEGTPFNSTEFHHIVATVNGGEVTVYLDGAPEFSALSSALNILGGQLRFFLDDTTEVADGRVALIRIHEGALTAAEVRTLAAAPFGPVQTEDLAVPLPGAALLWGFGVLAAAVVVRRRR